MLHVDFKFSIKFHTHPIGFFDKKEEKKKNRKEKKTQRNEIYLLIPYENLYAGHV